MLKITEKEVVSLPDNLELGTSNGQSLSFGEFLKTVTEVIKTGAKALKEAGLDYETIVKQIKEKLAEIIKNLIDFKIDFFEMILESIIIMVVNLLIDKIVKELFEE